MRPAYFVVAPQVDADGLAQAQAVAGAGNLTLNGAMISSGKWTSAGDFGQLVSITSSGADSDKTFTVTGLTPEGRAETEVITGPATATVTGSKYFREITSIAASAACAGNISAGFAGASATHAFVPNYKMENFKASLGVTVSGTINCTVQHTFSEVFDRDTTSNDWTWFSNDSADLVGLTANQDGNYAYPPRATRLIVNSVTSPGSATYCVIVPA